jgi:uncharacterized RDD family membrane protein YckC
MDFNQCTYCGTEIHMSADFCSNCGYSNRSSFNDTDTYRTGGLESKFYWMLRIFAFIIDSIIVGIVVFAAFAVLFIPYLFRSLITGQWLTFQNFIQFPFSMGLFQVAYFTVLEGWYHSSFGKRLLGMKIIKINGRPPSFFDAFLRNISKIHIIFLFIDLFFGVFVFGLKRWKITDRIAGVSVAFSSRLINRIFKL